MVTVGEKKVCALFFHALCLNSHINDYVWSHAWPPQAKSFLALFSSIKKIAKKAKLFNRLPTTGKLFCFVFDEVEILEQSEGSDDGEEDEEIVIRVHKAETITEEAKTILPKNNNSAKDILSKNEDKKQQQRRHHKPIFDHKPQPKLDEQNNLGNLNVKNKNEKNKEKKKLPPRYFILRSNNEENVRVSIEQSLWATQKRNEDTLNAAFEVG